MKTKVIAFRVTEDVYRVLDWQVKQHGAKLSDVVYKAMLPSIQEAAMAYSKEQKRLQAKAKRDAKKAARNAE